MTKVTGFEVDPGSMEALPRVNIFGAGEFLDADPPPIVWLIPGLLPLGVPTVMAAQGGLGKSFLALQMCIAMATGKGFLDYAPQAPCGASY